MKIQRWLAKNGAKLGKYFGKWVAISEDGVVAQANSVEELSGKLSEEQLSSLLLTRVPTPKEAGTLVVVSDFQKLSSALYSPSLRSTSCQPIFASLPIENSSTANEPITVPCATAFLSARASSSALPLPCLAK